jgi:hypothetical protein
MATEKQLKFVADIEAAVTAMTHERQPGNVKITEVLEMTNREVHNLRPLIVRLGELGELELLKRLQAAFARVDLKPTLLEKQIGVLEGTIAPDQDDAVHDEPLRLESRLPTAPAERPGQANGKGSSAADDIDTMAKVLRILETRPKASQAKVISSVAVFLGVGE